MYRRLFVFLLLLAIVGIALLVRVVSVPHDFSFDEIFTIRYAQHSFSEMWSFSRLETSPPLLYFLMACWIKLVGTGEIAVRSLSVIAGVALVIGMWFLGKELVSRRVGLYASAIIALSPLWIYFSREARMYSLLAAAFVWASFFGWAYCKRGGWFRAAAYSGLLLCSTLLHFGAWPPVGITMVWLCVVAFTKFRTRFIGIILAGAPTVFAIVFVFIRLMTARGGQDVSFLHHWAFLFSEFTYFIPQLLAAGFVTTANMYSVVVVAIFALLIVATAAGTLIISRTHKRWITIRTDYREERVWVFAVLAIPLLFAAAVHLQALRFLVISLAMLPLVVAIGAHYMRPVLRTVSLVTILVLCAWFIIPTQNVSETFHWEKLVAYVEAKYQPGDVILVHVFNEALAYNWYAQTTQAQGFFPKSKTVSFEDIITYNPLPNVNEENVGTLADYTKDAPRVFLIITHGESKNFWRGDLVLQWFRDHGWRQEAMEQFSEAGPDIGLVRLLVAPQ